MLSKIINFSEMKQKFQAKRNYKILVKKMVGYFESINPKATKEEILIQAVVSIENKRAAGQIDELNQLRTA